MKGVSFDGNHSYNDFFLILTAKKIDAPMAKTQYVDIPGGDGQIDLTEAFDEIKYYNRMLTFEFSTIVLPSQFLTLFSSIQNALQGKKMKIVLDDDPNFYYYGRIEIENWQNDKNIGRIIINCDCEPYKYKLSPTVIENTVTNSATLTFTNLKKRVNPKFTSSQNVQITFGTVTKTLEANTPITFTDIVFSEGENVVTVTGSTVLEVEYQERGL